MEIIFLMHLSEGQTDPQKYMHYYIWRMAHRIRNLSQRDLQTKAVNPLNSRHSAANSHVTDIYSITERKALR